MLSIQTLDVLKNLEDLNIRFRVLSEISFSFVDIAGIVFTTPATAYKFFRECFKGELFSLGRIYLKDAMLESRYQNLSSIPHVDEFMSLMREKRNFASNIFDENLYCEKFIKYLKQQGKKRELLTLIKLGADEKDCLNPITSEALLEKAESVSARSRIKRGRDSLQWISAKAVINHRIPTQHATETAVDIVNAAQTFYGLEKKSELRSRKKRRLMPIGVM